LLTLPSRPELLERASKARHVLADKGYDLDALRQNIWHTGAKSVVPGRAGSKRPILHNRGRHLIENACCRLKDFRRVATRYDKLAANLISAVSLAAIPALWI
jgi:transposase